MPLQEHTKSDVQQVLSLLKAKLASKDVAIMATIAATPSSQSSSSEEVRTRLLADVQKAISFVEAEPYETGESFHSRNPLAGLAQAHLNGTANETIHSSPGDNLPAVVDVYGEGNPIVWAPVMINILLQHLLPKADFQVATDDKSYIKIPDKCSIALLGDWGADNDHALNIAKQVRARKPDIAIHLGDIYYAGTQYETERFLANWPLNGPGLATLSMATMRCTPWGSLISGRCSPPLVRKQVTLPYTTRIGSCTASTRLTCPSASMAPFPPIQYQTSGNEF